LGRPRGLTNAQASTNITDLLHNLGHAITAARLLRGPIFPCSDTWQLVINPVTSIVSILIVVPGDPLSNSPELTTFRRRACCWKAVRPSKTTR
jgi:hypothetical protein